MSRENYIRVETRLIASLQRAGYTNDLGLLYMLGSAKPPPNLQCECVIGRDD